MSCKPTYKGVRYNSLEELYKANGVNTQQAQQLYSQYLDSLNTIELYSKLGNKTESGNVTVVKNIFTNKNDKNIITAFRVDKKLGLLESFRKYNAIGNPINWQEFEPRFEGDNATIAFMDWFLGKDYTYVEQEYRQEILNNLDNLKGKTIEYYKELGRPSHATALDYLINQLGSKQDIEGFEKYVRRGSANNRAANLEVSEAALIEYFNVLEESMYQDRNSYYRGYLGEPEIDKDGNLILRPTNAEWQKKLSNTGNGISFTSKLSEAERYGELRFEQRSRDIMDTFLSVYDQESELEILEEQGYTIVQINKSLVSSTLEGVEDEARLVTDEPLVIPKGAYKLQRYDSNGPKEPVVVTTLDKNGEPVYVPQQITITEESVVRKELSDLIRDTRENGLLDNNDFNCS